MPENQSAAGDDGHSKDDHSRHIVVVDDEEGVRLSLEMMLQHLGCQVTALDSGEALLSALDLIRPASIIFLDQNMKGMSGTDTYAQLRRQSVGNRIYFLTGGLNSAAIQAFQQGDPECQTLQKPVSLKTLQSVVESVTS